MRSSRAATVTSLEPCPRARSKGPCACPAHQRARPLGQPHGLGCHAAAPVAPDHLVLQAEALAQLHRLGEVAHRDAHLCPRARNTPTTGPHDEHMGAVGQVDPDAHRARGAHDLVDLVAAHGRGHRQGEVRAGRSSVAGSSAPAKAAIAGWRWIGVR